jgi:hypothetical protein
MHNRDGSSPFSVQHVAYRGGSSLIGDDGGFVPLISHCLGYDNNFSQRLARK